MSESKGFWNNATVAAVVGGVGVPIALGVAHYLGLTIPGAFAWFRAVAAFWGADVTVSRWVFWLWVLFTAIIAILICLQIRYNLQQPDGPVKPDSKPASFADYRTDLFFGFRWRWTVYTGGTVGKVRMYCPECDYELSANDFERTRVYGEFLCRCGHCSFAHTINASAPFEIADKVEKAAERKIRTGEWRHATKQTQAH